MTADRQLLAFVDSLRDSGIQVSLSETEDALNALCVAPLTSMFFFGENQPRPGDFRPKVHDSDGLMMAVLPEARAETSGQNAMLKG